MCMQQTLRKCPVHLKKGITYRFLKVILTTTGAAITAVDTVGHLCSTTVGHHIPIRRSIAGLIGHASHVLSISCVAPHAAFVLHRDATGGSREPISLERQAVHGRIDIGGGASFRM